MKENHTPATIDAYIQDFPMEIQNQLQKLRSVIRENAPGAEETIAYRIPTFRLKENLVHFAAFKNHIGFYPAPSAIKAFANELSPYKTARGSVQFPMDEHVPFDLVARIVQFRVAEQLRKISAK